MQQASNVRSANKEVDDAGKLEHVEDEHCDYTVTASVPAIMAIESHEEHTG
jgi:hypothetical protein